MFNLQQILLICTLITIFSLSFYKKIDWFKFFIVLKTLHLYVSVSLLHDVLIYNSTSVLVSILYILCVSVLKSVVSILLMIINQNKNNSLSF